jgi:hypothetical protein
MTTQKTKTDGGTLRQQLNLIRMLLLLFQSKEIGLIIGTAVLELLHAEREREREADMAKSRGFANFRFRDFISICVSACIRSNPWS